MIKLTKETLKPKKKSGFSAFIESSSPSKFIGFFSVVILMATGLVATFANSPIDIDKFVKFLGAFSFIIVPFIMIVALGRGAKNYLSAKYGVQEEKKDEPPK